MGPSDDSGLTQTIADALLGSNTSLQLCNGDVFIVKSLCKEQMESEILSISLTVTLVKSVKIYLVNSDSNVIGGSPLSVSILLKIIYVINCN